MSSVSLCFFGLINGNILNRATQADALGDVPEFIYNSILSVNLQQSYRVTL